MKIKHSKYKNAGILFELLVRQITADTLDGKDSPIKNILKKYFVKTELGKEYKLYEALLNKTSITETRADITITTLLESSKILNRRIIKKQKYNLINEVKEHYDLNQFFNHKLPHYKVQAAFYTLLEISNSTVNPSPEIIISNKMTILEYLTAAPIKEKEVRNKVLNELKDDKDLRLLTYRILLEKFNDKYEDLNKNQKEILKELIYSIDNKPKLKEFYNSKSNEIREELPLMGKVTKVTDEHLINLLQYCDLAKELELVNG